MLLWFDKLYYDARFFIGDDLYHRVFKMVNYVSLATAVQHISPAKAMSNSSGNADMLGFSLALVFCNALVVVRYVEIRLTMTDSVAAQAVAKRNILSKMLPISLYLASAIVAGVKHFGPSDGDETTDIPIGLCITAVIVDKLSSLIIVLKKKKGTIPHVEFNMDYIIHRLGEWTMLILGESILSLLIVEVVAGWDFYLTFYAGILSVIFLEYLHFRSQPHHVDEHAMRKSAVSGYAFIVFMQWYSFCLIILGVSYKLLLTEYVLDNDAADDDGHRILSSTPQADIPVDVRRQRIAHLFGASMAVVWACADIMMLLHKNWKHNVERVRGTCGGKILVILRVLLIIFCATFSQWQDTTPESIALIGLGVCSAQLVLRVLTGIAFPDERANEIIRKESQALLETSKRAVKEASSTSDIEQQATSTADE